MNTLLVIALLAYPLAVYYGVRELGVVTFGITLALLVLARLWLTGALATRARQLIACGIAVAFIAALLLHGDLRWLTLYPVVINAVLLVVFAASLHSPPTVIERGLRALRQPVPDEAVAYLWWVTLVWCGFFIVNGAIAAWSAFAAPLKVWALYNGVISYALIGVLLVGEMIVRVFYKRAVAKRAMPPSNPSTPNP
ncbi:MAG: hypothetical protein AAGA84_02120 [Pseudomonadota bacterium]